FLFIYLFSFAISYCFSHYVYYLHFYIIFFLSRVLLLLFVYNITSTTELFTLSLHDALPILQSLLHVHYYSHVRYWQMVLHVPMRSEEHTSELQSRFDLVCRLLLEKKKKKY